MLREIPLTESTPSPLPPTNSAVLAGLVFLALGVYAVPQFVRMPLTNDAQMYDLQARLVVEGGVLYQDILEPNLPGVVWIQSTIRQVAGWSSEALRGFDLIVFALVLVLIDRWFASSRWPAAHRLWLLTALLWYYVSQSEWCHCQRDGWLLLPVLGALTLRRNVTDGQHSVATSPFHIFRLTLCEGLLWASAVWLKPHVILPAGLVWITGTFIARPGKRVIPEVLGLLTGGLAMGAVGMAWMVQHGCWAAFWETARNWNPQYFAAGRAHWTLPRFLALSWRLSPWMLLHLPAVAISIRSIWQSLNEQGQDPAKRSQALLSACYLGWAVQAFFLQHLFDYIHAPSVLLAVLVVAGPIRQRFSEPSYRALVAGFVVLAVLASPLASAKRADTWRTCLTMRANPELYDRLAVFQNPHWQDLDQIARFLEKQNLAPRDVCCYHSDLVSLYNRLDLLPPSRFVYVHELTVFFPDQRQAILESLQSSPHRFIVTDMASAQLTEEQKQRLLSPAYQSALMQRAKKLRPYPWGHPIAFRAGNYLVHRIR